MKATWYGDMAGILGVWLAVVLLARLLPPLLRVGVVIGATAAALALLALVPRWWTDSGTPVDEDSA